MKIRIEIPALPGVALSPNQNPHWAVREKAKRELLSALLAGAYISLGMSQNDKLPPERVQIQYTFIVPNERRRDGDNWLRRMKPATDWLVRMGWLLDDDSKHCEFLPVRFEVDKKRAPATIVEIEELQVCND